MTKEIRLLSVIADEIREDWDKIGEEVFPHAEPYLQVMETLSSINDSFGQESGKSIVLYFLSNATHWRGDVARRVKAELRGLLETIK
jgi:hypothetical protein